MGNPTRKSLSFKGDAKEEQGESSELFSPQHMTGNLLCFAVWHFAHESGCCRIVIYSLHYNCKNGNEKSVVQKSQKNVGKSVKMHESSKSGKKKKLIFRRYNEIPRN